jgi:hypothetical protein
VCLANFLELSLNLLDSLVFKVLDFLQGILNDTEGLRVDLCSREQLVDLCILGLQGLLDGLQLLLENQVTQAGLLLKLIDGLVEGLEELVLLLFEVLVLLEAYFELPLDVLEFAIMPHDCFLCPSQ